MSVCPSHDKDRVSTTLRTRVWILLSRLPSYASLGHNHPVYHSQNSNVNIPNFVRHFTRSMRDLVFPISIIVFSHDLSHQVICPGVGLLP